MRWQNYQRGNLIETLLEIYGYNNRINGIRTSLRPPPGHQLITEELGTAHVDFHSEKVKIVNVKIELRDENAKFGVVKSAHLQVQGHIRTAMES